MMAVERRLKWEEVGLGSCENHSRAKINKGYLAMIRRISSHPSPVARMPITAQRKPS